MKLMQVHHLLFDRLCWMLRVNHTVVSMTLFSISGLLSLGFLFGDISYNTDYTHFSDRYVWVAAFGAYSGIKFIQALGRTPLCIRSINSIIGLWPWCYLFISFIILDKSPMVPAEPILLLPIVWELAYITSLIYIYRRVRSSLTRRADD